MVLCKPISILVRNSFIMHMFIFQIDSFEICTVVSISIVTAMLFDLPLQTICKMVVDKGTEEDIEANEHLLAQQEIDLTKSDDIQSAEPGGDPIDTTEPEIESIWEDKADEYVVRSNHSRSRSYSPLWKKDEEPHSWDFDDDQAENVENVDAANSKTGTAGKSHDSDEEDEEEEEDSESSADSVRRG